MDVNTNILVAQHRPHLRLWRDLSKWRLLLGLAFAPVLPIALGAVILMMLEGDLIFPSFGAVLAAAETWSMPLGVIFLVVSRFRGSVRRAHCLLLGAFLAFSLPSAAYATSKAIDWVSGAAPRAEASDEDLDFDDDFHGPSDGGIVFIIGLIPHPLRHARWVGILAGRRLSGTAENPRCGAGLRLSLRHSVHAHGVVDRGRAA